MEAVLLCDFDSIEKVLEEFGTDENSNWVKTPIVLLEGVEILLAYYLNEDYSGEAFVLLRDKEGKLFEVNGNHCSCYGLEDQWEPEETSIESLRHRVVDGKFGQQSHYNFETSENEYSNKFADELLKILDELEKENGESK